MLFCSRYDGDYIFAFDNVADAKLIERNIQLARRYTSAVMKFYCFCGFDRVNHWDADFWRQDVFDLFARIEILMRHRCLAICNALCPLCGKSLSRRVCTVAAGAISRASSKKEPAEFAELNGIDSACYKYLIDFEKRFPEVAHFYNMKYDKTQLPPAQFGTHIPRK